MNRRALTTIWAHLSTWDLAPGFPFPAHSHHTPPRTRTPKMKPAAKVPPRTLSSSLSSASSSLSRVDSCALMQLHPTYSCKQIGWSLSQNGIRPFSSAHLHPWNTLALLLQQATHCLFHPRPLDIQGSTPPAYAVLQQPLQPLTVAPQKSRRGLAPGKTSKCWRPGEAVCLKSVGYQDNPRQTPRQFGGGTWVLRSVISMEHYRSVTLGFQSFSVRQILEVQAFTPVWGMIGKGNITPNEGWFLQ